MTHVLKITLVSCLIFFSTLAHSHVLSPIIKAAKIKSLPTKILDEMVSNNSKISIKKGDWAYYKPGFFGGTIYLPFSKTNPQSWKSNNWTLFYNEAFHAWWGTVFMKKNKYANEKHRLINNSQLIQKYRRAHPKNPVLAMEEGYSETVATLIIMAYPRVKLNEEGDYVTYSPDFTTLYYHKGKTVAPVSHSESPGYTKQAENTFLNEAEYSDLMVWIFNRPAPPILD